MSVHPAASIQVRAKAVRGYVFMLLSGAADGTESVETFSVLYAVRSEA